MMLTEYEVRTVGLEGRSKEDIQAVQKQLDTWPFIEISDRDRPDMKKLLPCIQDEKPVFQNDVERVLFLQLLRQMRLVYKVVTEKKMKEGKKEGASQTDVHDTLTQLHKPRRVDYWLLPEFENRLNHWKNLEIPLYSNNYEAIENNKDFNKKFKPDGRNSARKKIFFLYKDYITGEL